MKKIATYSIIAAALAVTYSASAWYTGTRLETKLTVDAAANAIKSPYFKILKRQYKRGVFSATEDVTYEFNMINPATFKPPMPYDSSTAAAAATDATDTDVADTSKAAATNDTNVTPLTEPGTNQPIGATAAVSPAVPEAPMAPLQFHVIHHIQHGPFLSIASIGAASINTELVFDAKTQAELKKLFGNKTPLQIHSKLRYNGGGTVNIVSPAVTSIVGEQQDKVEWKGFTFNVDFDKDYQGLRIDGSAPGMDVSSIDGTIFRLGGLAIKADVTQAYPQTSIYLGKVELSLATVSYADHNDKEKSFAVQQISLATDTTSQNDLLNVSAKVGAARFAIGDQEFTDFHEDYAVGNLHGPTLVKLTKIWSATGTDEKSIKASMDAWHDLAPDFLQHDPEIALTRLSISTKAGNATLSGKAKLIGATAEDTVQPLQLLGKVQGDINIAITEELLYQFGATQKDPEIQAAMRESTQQQLANMEAQGYVKHEGKNLISKLVWKDGKLLVNGKEFARPGQ